MPMYQRPGMPSGARMPHQGAPMGPPGPPYGASPAVRPGLPTPVIEASRKRPAPSQQVQQQAGQNRTRNVFLPVCLNSLTLNQLQLPHPRRPPTTAASAVRSRAPYRSARATGTQSRRRGAARAAAERRDAAPATGTAAARRDLLAPRPPPPSESARAPRRRRLRDGTVARAPRPRRREAKHRRPRRDRAAARRNSRRRGTEPLPLRRARDPPPRGRDRSRPASGDRRSDTYRKQPRASDAADLSDPILIYTL
ncbi:unnamed protein product [Boreogadus saida]